ncbi:MAG: hemin uptake protein HemP [Hyphomicrobium sp.]|jgi:hemin uptake protein HemP
MTTAADSNDTTVPASIPENQEKKIRVQVAEILKGGREAILEHDGQDYRLRITSNGKLILTK